MECLLGHNCSHTSWTQAQLGSNLVCTPQSNCIQDAHMHTTMHNCCVHSTKYIRGSQNLPKAIRCLTLWWPCSLCNLFLEMGKYYFTRAKKGHVTHTLLLSKVPIPYPNRKEKRIWSHKFIQCFYPPPIMILTDTHKYCSRNENLIMKPVLIWGMNYKICIARHMYTIWFSCDTREKKN